MPVIPDLQKIDDYVTQKKGSVILLKCISVKNNLRWYIEFTCENKHHNNKRLDCLYTTWCQKCRCNTMEDAHKLATKMNGKFLSESYINVHTKYKWQCENGHIFESLYYNVHIGKWCKQCLCLSFDQLKALAEKKEGKCLTTKEEIGNNAISSYKCLWECKQGHQWKTTYSSVKSGSWCPECNETICERTCRKIFEFIFNNSFPKKRPSWLTNKGNLELDGFCENLNIAFEYNGSQHYNFVEYFHKTQERFETYKERDRIKNKLCEENGVTLINIPYTVKYDNLYSYILDQCMNTVVGVPNDIPEMIDYKVLNLSCISEERIKEIQIYLNENYPGSKIVSTEYVNNTTYLDFTCCNNHQLKSTWGMIISGIFCKECTYGKIRDGMQIRLNDFCVKFNLNCSDKYEKAKTPMNWTCNKCKFAFTRTWDKMTHQYKECQKCKMNKVV